jgi:transcriptional regulator with XRE-family HTH domain
VLKDLEVGQKIKLLRKAKKMTARKVASEATISVAMLSLLENGSTSGSVETLRKIAKVLDTTLAHLFTNDEVSSNNIDDESVYVVREYQRKKISFPDPLYTCELLVPDLQGDIELILVNLEPNRVTNEVIPHTKGGEECNYVTEGEIVVTLEDKEFILNKGDCIRFNPATAHKIENRSLEKASYISIITPVSF